MANPLPLPAVDPNGYDAMFLVGGQAPMYTFYNDERVHRLAADRVKAGRLTAVVCRATCVLLNARTSDGQLVVAGGTWTGFAISEEEFAESFVGKPIQPFRIEDEARKLTGTNFIVHGRFAPHAVRDGQLITGQRQHFAAAAARLAGSTRSAGAVLIPSRKAEDLFAGWWQVIELPPCPTMRE